MHVAATRAVASSPSGLKIPIKTIVSNLQSIPSHVALECIVCHCLSCSIGQNVCAKSACCVESAGCVSVFCKDDAYDDACC